ncbi:hypothetical protein BX666DRAFT_1317395 [Dichotomocladium elegans]|nr:hypothetical protein BX666DRAFT_1317395 [Dichotomocladium elegans]
MKRCYFFRVILAHHRHSGYTSTKNIMATVDRRSSIISVHEESSPPPTSDNDVTISPYDRWNRIDNWLQDLYTAEVPTYEKDDVTLQSLNELHAKTMEANRIMETVLQAQKQISDDNLRQAEAWQEKLDSLEFSKSNMSDEGKRSLDTLAMLAVRLGLDSTSLSSYQTAIAHLTMETMDAKIEVKDMKDTEYALQNRIDNAESELNKMKALLSSMRMRYQGEEKELMQHWQKDTEALKHQMEAAKPKYAMMQREYEALGVEQQELRLSAINKLEQDLDALDAVLAEKNSVISSYHDLPPVSLTRQDVA